MEPAAGDGPPSFMANTVEPLWGSAQVTGSPLVLDLSTSGSGITLSSVNSSGAVYWDFGDGFKHQSGWVTGTTGLLCVDPTGTGVITQADLFGNNGGSANGFQALAAYDTNNDGVINSERYGFRPTSAYGSVRRHRRVSQSSDLHTLASLGITSINLNYTNENYQINGNTIEEQSTFVVNGNTQTIADAWFAYDPVNTVYDGSWTFNPRSLPFYRTSGDMASFRNLAISMSMDSTLLSEVNSLHRQSLSQLLGPELWP